MRPRAALPCSKKLADRAETLLKLKVQFDRPGLRLQRILLSQKFGGEVRHTGDYGAW